MIVCDCKEVTYEMILEAVRTHGANLEAVMEETEAGTVCECCLEEDCDKVDLPLPLAIAQAAKTLG